MIQKLKENKKYVICGGVAMAGLIVALIAYLLLPTYHQDKQDSQDQEISQHHGSQNNEGQNTIQFVDQVLITEFDSQRMIQEDNVPAFKLSIKNNGERTIKNVKTVIYFQDEHDNIIHELVFHPQRISDFPHLQDIFLQNNHEPMKSGDVRLMQEFRPLKTQLNEWQEGKAFAKIVEVEFLEH